MMCAAEESTDTRTGSDRDECGSMEATNDSIHWAYFLVRVLLFREGRCPFSECSVMDGSK